MQIYIEHPASPGPVSITGTLSLHTAAALHEALRQCLAAETPVTVDLTGVNECDLAGAQLLCSARQTAIEMGKAWKAVLSPAILNTCEALGIPSERLSGACQRSV